MTAISVKMELIKAATEGDGKALEKVLDGIQDQVHALSRRILVDPEDAREATQEILILVLTKLSTFKGESSFSTWVYRVAVRYLVSTKKIRDRDLGLTFGMFAADLEDGLVAEPPKAPDDVLMLNELRVSCTMAMLLCLTMDLRLAYVLGDILELDHGEASSILEIAPAAYRKRLSRAREDVMAFTSRHCGVVSEAAKCSCLRRLPAAVATGRLTPGVYVNSSGATESYAEVKRRVGTVIDSLKAFELQNAVPPQRCPEDIRVKLTEILSPGI